MEKKDKTILVTGNDGYIGSVLTKHLKSLSYNVIGLDSGLFSSNTFYSYPQDLSINKQIARDIRDVTKEDLDGVDSIIHLAALSNDPLGEINPTLTDSINMQATIKLARLAKDLKIERFIFSSSCSIYGIGDNERPISEEGSLNPITAYAKAKVDAESALLELADKDFHVVIHRNATAYGHSPRLRLDLVVNNLLAHAYLTNEINVMSDGTPWRPIIHVDDICRAFICSLEAPTENISSQIFNVGINDDNYMIKDIANLIGEILPEATVKILNKTGPDERTYRVDFSKIKKILPDFKPEWNLKKGIIDLLECYKKHNLTLEDFNSDKYFRIRTVKSLIDSSMINKDLELTGGRR